MPQTQSAGRFRALHAKGEFLVLPNAWDVASARVAEEAGASAVATSSAAVSWAQGFPDGEHLPKERLIGLVKDIARVVKAPISADSEAGFSSAPVEVAQFVVALAKAGAVGINLEDGKDAPALLAEKIKAIKAACAREGVDVFINARTDVYLKNLVPAEKALNEALTRGKLYREAGADGFFVPWVGDLAAMKTIVETIDLPLNALTFRDLPPVSELKKIGVRRLSAGAGTARAALGTMRRVAVQLLNEGRYDAMNAAFEGLPNMNALME
jgi:2-methylisocitrate lyase-like PEP mutase family enzyme